MQRGILITVLLLTMWAVPLLAGHSASPDFLHKAWPILKPIFDSCRCEHYGVDEVLTWEDKHDSNIRYWTVMAVAVVKSPYGVPTALATLITLTESPGFPLHVVSISLPFEWTPDLQLVHERGDHS